MATVEQINTLRTAGQNMKSAKLALRTAIRSRIEAEHRVERNEGDLVALDTLAAERLRVDAAQTACDVARASSNAAVFAYLGGR